MFIGIAWAVGLFFAINIGASGTAASMGAAYGGGAIQKRWVALVLVAVSVFLGAYMGGGNVVKTVSGGIIPSRLINVETTIIILAGACITLFLANMIKVPLSTSEVTVGSLVGVGAAYQLVFVHKLVFLLCVWIALPFISYFVSYLLGKSVPVIERKLALVRGQSKIRTLLSLLLIGAGCYEAFSAGMNNVANAMGPLIGAGLVSLHSGLLFGAGFVALGAILLGGRVLDTNAKRITDLSLLQGTYVSLTSGTLVIIASVFGLPVPLTQATTMSILGVGSAKNGFALMKQGIVKRVVFTWITSPVSSLVVSYLLIKIFVFGQINIYAVIGVFSAVVIGAGYVNVLRLKRKRLRLSKQANEAASSNFSNETI